jgi:molecular chaperone GrpE
LTEEEKRSAESAENRDGNANEQTENAKTHDKKSEGTARELHHQLDTLKADLEKLKGEAAANLDGWQRERAEFSNYKKRIDRENESLHQTVTGSVIKKYLVILDDLELALKARPKEGEGAAWADGIELIARKLQSVLESEGIERINQNKVQFDPNLHEAISNEENPDFECGEIIEVVRQGYKLGDRILRPAMVRVAR